MKHTIKCLILLLSCIFASAQPDWWEIGDFTVIESGAIPNNHGPANIGQAKHMAWSALQTIRSIDPEMADEIERNLVGVGRPIPSWLAVDESDYAPLLVGQLKAISAPFYASINPVATAWLSTERVNNGTESGGIYPWTAASQDDLNNGIANIGQLKAVFSLRLTESVDSDPGSDYLEYRLLGTLAYHFDPEADSDTDGISNLEELRAVSIANNRDTDGDGLSDGYEMGQVGLDPFMKDTDGDGIPDGQTDLDNDLMSDQWEEELVARVSTDSLITDIYGISPNDDFDGDGLTNLEEFLAGYSGHETDTDGDGYGDLLSYTELIRLSLDESSGNNAADSGTEQHDGTFLVSPTWVPSEGIIGGAIELGGSGDGISIPEGLLDMRSDLSMSLWFKTAHSSNTQTLLSAAGLGPSPHFGVIIENGTTIRFVYGGGDSVTWNVGKNLSDGYWHHLVLVRDTEGSVLLYLDGNQFGQSQIVSISPLAVSAVTLGQYHQNASLYDPSKEFVGMIDEFRVFSTSLSPASASELFHPNDLDLDVLPDDYEDSLFGNLATLAASGDDLDEDGFTNREEFDAGTNPNDFYNGVPPVVTLVSGSGQTVNSGQRTAAPVVFLITDGTIPFVDAPVNLSYLELIGVIQNPSGDNLGTTPTLRTDSDGEITFYFKAD